MSLNIKLIRHGVIVEKSCERFDYSVTAPPPCASLVADTRTSLSAETGGILPISAVPSGQAIHIAYRLVIILCNFNGILSLSQFLINVTALESQILE